MDQRGEQSWPCDKCCLRGTQSRLSCGAAALVRELLHALDETASAEEARLKAVLKERLPILTAEMAAEIAVNDDVPIARSPPCRSIGHSHREALRAHA